MRRGRVDSLLPISGSTVVAHPPLSCRPSPPQGGRLAGGANFAKIKCRMLSKGRSTEAWSVPPAILPTCGGDGRQARGGRTDSDVCDFIFIFPQKHTSPFTRAVPPRGLTMHVPDLFALQRRSAGARRRAEVSGCLATAGKTRKRAPFGVFSSANSTVLRPSGPDLSGPGDGFVCDTTHATRTHLAAAPGGGPFSRTPDAGTYVFSPQQAPVPPPPASSCGVSRGKNGMILSQVWRAGMRGEEFFLMFFISL
jgi:hypothetical protein